MTDDPTSNSRIEELEDAITEAGIILSEGLFDEAYTATFSETEAIIKRAMRRLGEVMKDPAIMKRQGI